ncbi:helix-turn-helix transcriptional regulator [Microbacterium sp. KR10-403]|uniref:helix-turn-helix transcriptional regulator n=1 Tax=Microbacterium sp. KR10-403 TaxID=3158581 RepID=UPI0032E452DD
MTLTVEQLIGRNVAYARYNRHDPEHVTTQAQLGEAIGAALGEPSRSWSRQVVHQAEAGKRSWAVADLLIVASALGVSALDLLRPLYDTDDVEVQGCVFARDWLERVSGLTAATTPDELAQDALRATLAALDEQAAAVETMRQQVRNALSGGWLEQSPPPEDSPAG